MSAFSHIIDPATVQAKQRHFKLAPDEAQRTAIAKRLELPDLPAFTAEIGLQREKGSETLRLTGHVRARVVQSCVATLEPVESEIDHPFVERYSPDAELGDSEIVVDADEETDIDLLPEDGLDVAEIAVQHLSLALDPYPRAPGAEAGGDAALADSPDDVPSGPFAGLAVLKGGKK